MFIINKPGWTDASPQDILNLPATFTKADLAKAKKEAANTFHPDKIGIGAPPQAIKILNLSNSYSRVFPLAKCG